MALPVVVSKLRGIQVREGLSDGEMAKQLCCSRQLYQMTRTSKIPLGNKILRGISATFPELQKDVIYFLSNNDKKLSNHAKYPLRQPSEPQGRGLKRFFVELLGRIRK
ncbi:hypothetical protein ES707_07804 [subsurface metagenome]